MELYSRTQLVFATPMTRHIYHMSIGTSVPPNQDGSDFGYLIIDVESENKDWVTHEEFKSKFKKEPI